jgi:hypothetical protein
LLDSIRVDYCVVFINLLIENVSCICLISALESV